MKKEQVEEIALRVAKECDFYVVQNGDCTKDDFLEFIHALLAELAKEQKPFGYVYMVNGSWYYFDDSKPPEDAYDEGTLIEVFTLPQPDLVAKQQAEISDLNEALLSTSNLHDVTLDEYEKLNALYVEQQAHIAMLRDTLGSIVKQANVYDRMDIAMLAHKALATTPESSLREHDAKLVEHIAADEQCKARTYIWLIEIADKIRKGF